MASIECNVNLHSGAQTDPGDVKNTVSGHSSNILGEIGNLKGSAESLRDRAEALLAQVGTLPDTDSEDIEFDAALSDYTRAELSLPPALRGLYRNPNVQTGSFDSPPELRVQPFAPSPMQDAPAVGTFQFPVAPQFSRVGSMPAAPATPLPNIPDAPDVTVNLQGLPGIDALPPFTMEFPEIEVLQVEAPNWADIPLPDASVLARYDRAVEARPVLADYNEVVVHKGLQAADALLRGEFILDMEELDAGTVAVVRRAADRHAGRMQGLWSRRGLPQTARAMDRRDAAVSEHTHAVRERMLEEAKTQFAASVERWRMRLLPVALQLNVEAHGFLVEKRIQMLDLDFEMLAAEKEAQIGLYALLAAKFRIASAKIMQRAAEYRAEVERVRAQVASYAAFVDQQQNVARLNQARAGAYSAQQDAKVVETAEFEAYVSAGKAVVRAYNAMIRGVQGRAQALGAQLAQFEARSAQWQAELVDVRTAYSTRRAENQAIVAENRATAAQISADASSAEAVAAASTQSAAEVSSEAAMLRAEIANRMAVGSEKELQNAEQTLRYRADVTDYRIDASEYSTRLLQDVVDYAAIDQNNSAIAGLAGEVTSAVGRAAELTQRYQTQIAQSYVDLAGTLAEAEAARVSGRVAPFRASAGLTARGDVSYRSRADDSSDFSWDYTSSQGNTCRTIFREARM